MSSELLTREALAQRLGGVRNYVSASRLNLWLKCPLAFKLKYVDGLVMPTSPAAFIGKRVHAALETYYRHRQLGLLLDAQELARRQVEFWDEAVAQERVVFESTANSNAARQQTIDLVAAYLLAVPADEPRPLAVEAAVEAPLVDPVSGEDLGIPLVGVIDLVLEEAAGPLVTDFKTAARSNAALEITHEIQLSSYSYLLRHSLQRREAGLEIRSLVKTKVPQIQFQRYTARTEQHFRRLFAAIRAYLEDLDRGSFVYRPGLGCSMCDYRHAHCPQWSG